jgi:hypothetical protein
MVLADCQLVYEITATPFEREARVRMGGGEVEGFDGVGRGLMGLVRLWKCVEKWGETVSSEAWAVSRRARDGTE